MGSKRSTVVMELDQGKYKVTWADGTITFLHLSFTQAQNLSGTPAIKLVELENG